MKKSVKQSILVKLNSIEPFLLIEILASIDVSIELYINNKIKEILSTTNIVDYLIILNTSNIIRRCVKESILVIKNKKIGSNVENFIKKIEQSIFNDNVLHILFWIIKNNILKIYDKVRNHEKKLLLNRQKICYI